MRIAWFTPFAKNSAIGKISKSICEELLMKEYYIEIFTPKAEEYISSNVLKINIIDINTIDLSLFDLCIYNLGNYYPFHYEIAEVLNKKSGIVIFHDRTMLDYWVSYHKVKYGENAFKYFKNFLKKIYPDALEDEIKKAFLGDNREKFNCIIPFLKNAESVFCHAKYFMDEVSRYFNGSVSFAYLPCELLDGSIIECDEDVKRAIEEAKIKGKKIIVSTGIVQDTKQIDKIVEVFITNDWVSERYLYLIVGDYDNPYGNELKKVTQNSRTNSVFWAGYRNWNTMVYSLCNSDLCINFRYPNTEVCSLSLFEQMSSGTPVLVLNSGVFGEMPDEFVYKFNHGSLRNELDIFLKEYFEEKDIKKDKSGRKFIEDNCTISKYIEALSVLFETQEYEKDICDVQNTVIDYISSKLNENERKNIIQDKEIIEIIKESIEY